MSGTPVASTPKETMHALAFQGIVVFDSFSQIRDMLLRKFGEDLGSEYMLIFSRPFENRTDGRIDWYSPVKGEVKKFADIPEADREKALGHIAAIARAIQGFSEELINSHEPLKVTRGNILRLALCYPNEDDIYMVGEQPVLTCWGFGPGTPGVEGKNLSRIMENRPAPRPAAAAKETSPPPSNSPAPSPAGPRNYGCLWWLLPFLALLLLLSLLFCGFGSYPAISGDPLFKISLPRFLDMPEDSNTPRIAELEEEIKRLQDELEKKAGQCVSEKPKAAAPRQELAIPDQASTPDFLAGEWICETGLSNSTTGDPVQLSFSFDKKGEGRAETVERGGNNHCSGDARSEMRNGILFIQISEQKCENGKSYNAATIECRPGKNGAECFGKNEGGPNFDAIFQRVR